MACILYDWSCNKCPKTDITRDKPNKCPDCKSTDIYVSVDWDERNDHNDEWENE